MPNTKWFRLRIKGPLYVKIRSEKYNSAYLKKKKLLSDIGMAL
jgi:hypothetical protein